MLRRALGHWPESLLILLFLVGGNIPFVLLIALWIRIALIPVGWVAAFGVWIAIIFFACWLYSKKSK
jgi:hypothetical protein